MHTLLREGAKQRSESYSLGNASYPSGWVTTTAGSNSPVVYANVAASTQYSPVAVLASMTQ